MTAESEQEEKPWQARLLRFLLEKGLLAVIVFVSTSAATLWTEKQKAMTAIRLNDSNLIAEGTNALWKDILKLEMDYDALHRAKQKLWFTTDMLKQKDDALVKSIRDQTETLAKAKDAVSNKILQETHAIGEPMVRHMAVYLSFLDGFYRSEDDLIGAKNDEASAFNTKMASDLGQLLAAMRGNVATTREYALRQVSHY